MKWISVKERLPEEQTYILLWVGCNINQWVKHYYTHNGKWVSMERFNLPRYYEVNFWMPLPEPPSEPKSNKDCCGRCDNINDFCIMLDDDYQ